MKVRVTRRQAGVVDVPIHTEFIKLQDFLKFANAVPSGGMAKTMIQAGDVSVNGRSAPCGAKSSTPATRSPVWAAPGA